MLPTVVQRSRAMILRMNLISLVALAMLFPLAGSAQGPTVAMTVDDLPFASPSREGPSDATTAKRVNEKILTVFARHHVPATGFVVEKTAEDLGLPASIAMLRLWTKPGFSLGNPFYSHADVNTLTV